MLLLVYQALLSGLLVLAPTVQAQRSSIQTKDVGNCSCGYYDDEAKILFTESSIVYFNESSGIPTDFVVEEFAHRYDRGWNSLYRQGASINNVQIANDSTARNLTSLQMSCDPSDDEHLVVGSSIRTARQDIFFGSFRSSLRPARSWQRGSVISMSLTYNQTESWEIDVMNTDNNTQAWVSMLMQGQFPNTWLGANFTNLTLEGFQPWFYEEYRVDWTRDSLNYYIGGVLQKSYNTSVNSSIPATPAPLHFQHWSLGNKYSSQGPPLSTNQANIGWTRLFFNSSAMTDDEHAAFNARCSIQDACLMSDNSLRGASAYGPESAEPWTQSQPPYEIKWVPLIIDIIFAAAFIVLTSKTLWRRFSWHKLLVLLGVRKREEPKPKSFSADEPSVKKEKEKSLSLDGSETSHSQDGDNGSTLPRNASYNTLNLPPYKGTQTPAPQYQTPAASRRPSLSNMTQNSFNGPFGTTNVTQGESSRAASRAPSIHGVGSSEPTSPQSTAQVAIPEANDSNETQPKAAETKPAEKAAAVGKDGNPAAGSARPPRIDYLAGFISISCLLVTANHFGLTYFGGVISPDTDTHYYSEVIARKSFATYFLDPLWIGPFLMISTRFLTSNYIRTGKLDNMAQKVVARPFRLLTPVASIAFLIYFLMDSGAVNWLEYLPSVTWSFWPFTTVAPNPGVYISEILQLAFLIPNAAPMITNNYCTGSLWTIPVQLQGAWQTLLALIMIRECKTPWKRFVFYFFCTAMHWYAHSWGSYYYAGVLLADLDLTFKYKKWIQPKWYIYWPYLIFFSCVAIGGFTIDMVAVHTGVQYAAIEYGWHPDPYTGLSIGQAQPLSYPDYFIPRLNALLSTVAMQMVVEICPTIQKAFSIKIFQWLFPHIFSVYLIHGFIFWSVGSWAMVSLFSYGLPYWLCTLLTAIVSYGTLFASLPLLTPPIEALGKSFTMRLWEHASQEPVAKKPTTYPFGEEFLTMRGQQKSPSYSFDTPSSPSGTMTPIIVSEKGKEVYTSSREL
ncbi:hypothetical protein BGW36DRAFT_370318 [Talaromyces proteolyticus]|uniref:GH16 domain-containing protein n=1 Tax=Talaromyces proteolyticus TaxID=1131652 RepID=A0AAD4Q0D4_9EURO|nr:uncharacterized protein BGW36DRAFT_370318 [Talaromyces proteolyticus]KAH8703968.1 hypothetical protein BGW36DRAFT_370318 [Talaromyces proteolyticus]